MTTRRLHHLLGACLAFGAVALLGCGNGQTEVPVDDPAFPGIFDDSMGQLDSISCTRTGTAIAFAIADGETAIVSLRTADKAILVNGAQCNGDSTTTNTKKLTVTGDSGDNTLILDFLNGTFLPGSGTAVGIDIDFGGATDEDVFRIRGSKAVDSFTIGADDELAINTDANADIAYAATTVSITVSLGDGADKFSAAGGAGTGTAFTGATFVYGGPGKDTLTGGDGVDTFFGGDGDDTLKGGDGADMLYGEVGNDTFDEGTATNGGDTFDGGDDTDTVSYASRTNTVTVTMDDGNANDGESGENDEVLDTVEGVTGGSGDDDLTGGDGNDVLKGGAGADRIEGGLGLDVIDGGDGDDTIDEGAEDSDADVISGGKGTDTIDYSARTEGVTCSLDGTANDGKTGAAEGDNVKNDIENILGSDEDDVLTGSASANVITGGEGNDTLSGLGDNDTFDESAEGNGADAIAGGDGTDTVLYSDRTVTITVTMADGLANDGESGETDNIGSDVENLTCGTGDCVVTGNAKDNVLDGRESSEATLSGGDGNDTLWGGDGDDALTGGAGDDTIDGAAGSSGTIDCGAGSADLATGDGSPGTGCEL